jgi:hypothetical protein
MEAIEEAKEREGRDMIDREAKVPIADQPPPS